MLAIYVTYKTNINININNIWYIRFVVVVVVLLDMYVYR